MLILIGLALKKIEKVVYESYVKIPQKIKVEIRSITLLLTYNRLLLKDFKMAHHNQEKYTKHYLS